MTVSGRGGELGMAQFAKANSLKPVFNIVLTLGFRLEPYQAWERSQLRYSDAAAGVKQSALYNCSIIQLTTKH